jgi:hypothetical protein
MDKYVRTNLMHLVLFVARSLNMEKQQSYSVTTNCSSTPLNFVKICPVAVVSCGVLTTGHLAHSRHNKHEAICTSHNRRWTILDPFKLHSVIRYYGSKNLTPSDSYLPLMSILFVTLTRRALDLTNLRYVVPFWYGYFSRRMASID